MIDQQILKAQQRFRLRHGVAPTHLLVDEDTLGKLKAHSDDGKRPERVCGLSVVENWDGINAVAIIEEL